MLKFILIAIVVIYLFAKVSKYLMRWAFLFAGKKMQQEMEKQYQAQQGYQQGHTQDASYQQDDMTIHVPVDKSKKKRTKNYPGGEYVDFEEV